jgi:hypothetical protein
VKTGKKISGNIFDMLLNLLRLTLGVLTNTLHVLSYGLIFRCCSSSAGEEVFPVSGYCLVG